MKIYVRKYRLQICFCTLVILFEISGVPAFAQCVIPSPQKTIIHSERFFVFKNVE